MTDWFDDLSSFRQEIWGRLERAAADRKSSARFVVLSTVSLDGAAEARTVVLRAARRASATLEIYSDARAAKVEELRIEPRATLVFWDAKARLQARLRAVARIVAGEPASARWRSLPEPSRREYAAITAPGQPIAGPADQSVDLDAAAQNFIVIELPAAEIDALYLGREGHRRAVFERVDDWSGRWLQP